MSLAIPGIGPGPKKKKKKGIGPGWYFETHYLDLTPLFLSGQGKGTHQPHLVFLYFCKL